MSEKRILITRLAADAWDYVCENFPWERVAVQTGCGMAADGSTDKLIKLQGLPQDTPYTYRTSDAGEVAEKSDSESEPDGDSSDDEAAAIAAKEAAGDHEKEAAALVLMPAFCHSLPCLFAANVQYGVPACP